MPTVTVLAVTPGSARAARLGTNKTETQNIKVNLEIPTILFLASILEIDRPGHIRIVGT